MQHHALRSKLFDHRRWPLRCAGVATAPSQIANISLLCRLWRRAFFGLPILQVNCHLVALLLLLRLQDGRELLTFDVIVSAKT
jgi:hypothetical protein